jgi:hypothetical protein
VTTRIGISRHGPRATLSARAVFRQIAVLALAAALAAGGWFRCARGMAVRRFFSLIECFQSVASRRISVMGGLVPIHVVRLPANPGPLTHWMAGTKPAISSWRRFQSCIERIQSLGRLFLSRARVQLWHSRGSRDRARSAARPRTRCCGFEASETIPFPGADSIFSSRCDAISGRLGSAVSRSRAIPATATPLFKGSTIGSAVSVGTAERGRSRYRSRRLRSITRFAHVINICSSHSSFSEFQHTTDYDIRKDKSS